MSASLDQLELPLTKLQEFRPGTNRAQWPKFEVDRLGGLFVFWPDLDLHLGWPELKRIYDPEYVRPVPEDLIADIKRFGLAFRSMCKERRLSQQDLADKVKGGSLLTKMLSRFEKGQQLPSAVTIVKIAGALDFSSDNLLNELENRAEDVQVPLKG